MKSNVKDLINLDLKVVQLSTAHLEFYLDGKVIHEWIEPLMEREDCLWHNLEVNGSPYKVNYLFSDAGPSTITFYGWYEEAGESYTTHDDSFKVYIVSLVQQVMDEMRDDFDRGDLDCIRELLQFVPVENLKGYLPAIY